MPGKLLKLEELSSVEFDALDRMRTVILLPMSPIEAHGSHLPLGVDFFNAIYFAERIGSLIIENRSDFTAVLAPGIPLGSQLYRFPGSLRSDSIAIFRTAYNFARSMAGWGFKYIFMLSGHGAPKDIVALEYACVKASRKFNIEMHNLSGALAVRFLKGEFIDRISKLMPSPISDEQKELLRMDLHGGWWETSMMLLLRPELVKSQFQELPSVKPGEKSGDRNAGYYGSPALAHKSFAQASMQVMSQEALVIVEKILDGRASSAETISPYFKYIPLRPFFKRYVILFSLALLLLLIALIIAVLQMT
jgi:creatinine amidohydrolase